VPAVCQTPQELRLLTPRVARAAAIFGLFVVISAITRAVSLRIDILNVDETSYIVGAWQLLKGRWPYIAFADNKPPLIYAYYALTQVLLGRGMLSVRLVTMLATVPLTAFALSAYYRHDKRGIVAGLIYLLYSAAYFGDDMLATNCEVVMLLPLAWALVCLRDGAHAVRAGWVCAAGLLIGVATLVKYQAILWLPGVALAVLIVSWPMGVWRSLRHVLALCVGVAVPLVAAAAVFSAGGGLKEFMYWNVTHNVSYVMNTTPLGEAAWRMAVRVLPFLAATFPLWLASKRSISIVGIPYQTRMVAGLMVGSAAAAFLGFRFFPHYFVQLYVPLAIGAAPWLSDIAIGSQAMRRSVVVYSVALWAAFTAVNAAQYLGPEGVKGRPEHRVLRRIAERLSIDRCYATGTLFVWGSAPSLYYMSRLPPATRFFFPEHPLVPHVSGSPSATRRRVGRHPRGTGRLWKWLIADLKHNKPVYLVDMAPGAIKNWHYFPMRNYPWLHRMVDRHYDLIDSIQGVEIYRRRGCGT